MKKPVRMFVGGILAAIGVVFFVLPGSMLFLIAGLLLLSYDLPHARKMLNKCQRSMSQGARKLDRYLLNRKLR